MPEKTISPQIPLWSPEALPVSPTPSPDSAKASKMKGQTSPSTSSESAMNLSLPLFSLRTYPESSPRKIMPSATFWQDLLAQIPPSSRHLNADGGQTRVWLLAQNEQPLGGFKTVNFTESPNVAVACSLRQVLERNVPRKYFLSARACLGILRRALKRGRALPQRLEMALRAMIGAAKVVQPRIGTRCPACDGSGEVPFIPWTFEEWFEKTKDLGGTFAEYEKLSRQTTQTCGECGGKGWLDAEHSEKAFLMTRIGQYEEADTVTTLKARDTQTHSSDHLVEGEMPDTASTVTARTQGQSNQRPPINEADNLIVEPYAPEVAASLRSNPHNDSDPSQEADMLVETPLPGDEIFKRRGGRGWSDAQDISPTLESGSDKHTGGPDPDLLVFDARGGGDGRTVNTLSGDHADRPTDFTPLVLETGDEIANAIDSMAGGPDDNEAQANLVVAYNIQSNDGGEHKRQDRPEGGMYVQETDQALTVGSTDLTAIVEPMVFQQNQRDEVRDLGAQTGAVAAQPGMKQQNFIVDEQPPIAFDWQSGGDVRLNISEEHTGPLQTGQTPAVLDGEPEAPIAFDWQAGDGGKDESFRGKSRAYIVRKGEYAQVRANAVDAVAAEGLEATEDVTAFTERGRAEGRNVETQENLAYALTNPGQGGRTQDRQVAGVFGVRRLTPVEVSRLQAFPDDWTQFGIDENGKVFEQKDSPRYKQAGNAVTVSVVAWIAARLRAQLEQEAEND